jgi:hypothetical protein
MIVLKRLTIALRVRLYHYNKDLCRIELKILGVKNKV